MQPTSPSLRLCHGIVLYPASQSFSAPPPSRRCTGWLDMHILLAPPTRPQRQSKEPDWSISLRSWMLWRRAKKMSATVRLFTPSVVTLFQSPKNYALKIPSGVNMAGLRWGGFKSGIDSASRLAASVCMLSLSWVVCWLILCHGHCSVLDSYYSFIFLPSLNRSPTHTQTGLNDSSQ